MAKKAKKENKVLNEVTLENGVKIITYEDGTVTIIPAPINLTADEAKEILGSDEEEEEDEDNDDEDDSDDEDDDDEDDSDDEDDDDEDDSDDEEEEELTGEDLAEMDFEELEEVCDDKDLEVDPEDYEEDDIEKFRKAIAKELGLKLPAAKAKKDKKKGKK